MNTIKIKIEDIWQGGPEPKNHSPVYDYCRKLIKEGLDPETRLEIYRAREEPDMVVSKIEEGAKWAIVENEKEGPRVLKYRPFPASRRGRKA